MKQYVGLDVEPRISALAGTFLMYGIAFFPRRELSSVAAAVSTLLTLIGSAGAIAALSQLGRSFSIMAKSRHLVTTGAYKWVRHPLYLAEEIAFVGLFMQFISASTSLLFLTQIAFQLRRIHNEEAVLSGSFPEYDIYRRTRAWCRECINVHWMIPFIGNTASALLALVLVTVRQFEKRNPIETTQDTSEVVVDWKLAAFRWIADQVRSPAINACSVALITAVGGGFIYLRSDGWWFLSSKNFSKCCRCST